MKKVIFLLCIFFTFTLDAVNKRTTERSALLDLIVELEISSSNSTNKSLKEKKMQDISYFISLVETAANEDFLGDSLHDWSIYFYELSFAKYHFEKMSFIFNGKKTAEFYDLYYSFLKDAYSKSVAKRHIIEYLEKTLVEDLEISLAAQKVNSLKNIMEVFSRLEDADIFIEDINIQTYQERIKSLKEVFIMFLLRIEKKERVYDIYKSYLLEY